MLSRLVFKCGNFWISAFLHIFLIKYTSQPISQCSALYLSRSLLRPSSDTAGYTSGNGIYCSRQLLWDVAVTPAPIITVEQFLTRPTIMYGCQTDRKRMEREFSCEKKDVPKCFWEHTQFPLLQDPFWSAYSNATFGQIMSTTLHSEHFFVVLWDLKNESFCNSNRNNIIPKSYIM